MKRFENEYVEYPRKKGNLSSIPSDMYFTERKSSSPVTVEFSKGGEYSLAGDDCHMNNDHYKNWEESPYKKRTVVSENRDREQKSKIGLRIQKKLMIVILIAIIIVIVIIAIALKMSLATNLLALIEISFPFPYSFDCISKVTNLPQILEILSLTETTKLLTGFLGTSGVNAMQIATVEKEQGVENVIQTMQR